MAIEKSKKLLELFQQLTEQEKNSALDFMDYLARRKSQAELDKFYSELPEVDEPFSDEEKSQMKDAKFISWEEAARELGWEDEH